MRCFLLLSLLILFGCTKPPINPTDTSVIVTVVFHKVYEGNLYIYRNFSGDSTRNVTMMGCPDSINGTTTNYWKGDTLMAVYFNSF